MMLGPCLGLHCLPLLADIPAALTESLSFVNDENVTVAAQWCSELVESEGNVDNLSDSSVVPDVPAVSHIGRVGTA